MQRTTKPYVGEELILSAAIKMSAIVQGKKEANEIRKISLSNNTVCQQIFEISEDQCEQLILRIKESRKFAIQVDELTDITKMAHLLAYVRYVYNNDIHEDLLFCQPLHWTYYLGWIFFMQLMIFLRKWVGMFSTDFVGVCTDKVAAMTEFHARV